MATTNGKARCVTCGKEKSTVRCDGCSQPFCYNHLGDHRLELSKQFDEIEVIRDLFRQTLTEQTIHPDNHTFIEQIDQWENNSINTIRETANEARQLLRKYTVGHLTKLEVQLNQLTGQLRESREENDFFEEDLHRWTKQLTKMKQDLNKSSAITVQQTSSPLVNKISVHISTPLHRSNISIDTKWIQDGVTVAGGNGPGDGPKQLSCPHGLYVDDDDETIYVADCTNHRIIEWKSGATNGQVVAGGNGRGSQNNQLNYPTNVIVDQENDSLIICDQGNQRVMRWPRRNGISGEPIISNIDCYGVAIDSEGYLYVSNYHKHEVRRWKIGDTNGVVVAGGNGQGNHLDQLNGPTRIFVDQDRSVYISDYNNHRVMKWEKDAKEGSVVAGGQGQGNGLTQLHNPWEVVVDQLGTVYIADYHNHRVMRWLKGATQGSVVVGGNGTGGEANHLANPSGLSFDRQDHFYVSDYNNNRVQKFNMVCN